MNLRKTEKEFVLFFLAFALSITTASALTIDIQTQDSFSTGEQIYFNYTISSDTTQQITFTPHLMCPNAPIAFLQEQTITLQPNIPYHEIYTDMQVSEQFEPQTCTASVQIISPTQQREEKTFEISTLPSFSFSINLDKSVYVKSQDIKIDYTSEIQNPVITATLTSPSGKIENIEIPSTINLDEIGTYSIEATATKQGYKTIQTSRQIGIIESDVNILEGTPAVSAESGEEKSRGFIWILLGIGLLVLIFIPYLIYKKIKRNKVELEGN